MIVMKQAQLYVCTLEEFILVDVVTLLYKDELRYGLNLHWFIYNYLNRLRNVRTQLSLGTEEK